MFFNITLFVQIVHFGIAYMLLKYLFFIPTLRLIAQQKNALAKIEQAIIGLEDTLVTLKKQQRKELELLKAHFLSHLPTVIFHSGKTLALPQKDSLLKQTQEDIEKLYQFRETLKNLLSQKLHG